MTYRFFWRLPAAAAALAVMAACAHDHKPAPAAQPAAHTPQAAPQAGAPMPAASAAAAMPQEKAEGPYLYELLQERPHARAWQRMSAKAPGWIRKAAGPTAPATQVTLAGKTYWQGSVCQQHNCPNTFFFLIGEGRAYGVQGDFGNLRRLKPRFYGAPPQAERAALQAAFDEERKRQAGAQ